VPAQTRVARMGRDIARRCLDGAAHRRDRSSSDTAFWTAKDADDRRIYTRATKPLRCRQSYQGASTARSGSRRISRTTALMSRTARRSRRSVNRPRWYISMSLGVNCSTVSAAKSSAHGLPQTRCANASLSGRNSASMCRANAVVSPQ
jgi:hypothetical protein